MLTVKHQAVWAHYFRFKNFYCNKSLVGLIYSLILDKTIRWIDYINCNNQGTCSRLIRDPSNRPPYIHSFTDGRMHSVNIRGEQYEFVWYVDCIAGFADELLICKSIHSCRSPYIPSSIEFGCTIDWRDLVLRINTPVYIVRAFFREHSRSWENICNMLFKRTETMQTTDNISS